MRWGFTGQSDNQQDSFRQLGIGLGMSLVLMYLVHMVQRAEETLVVDAQEYCQEHLLLRLYDPQAEGVNGAV